MEQQNWIDVPEEQQETEWVDYRLIAKCICGKDIDILDAAYDGFTCECGQMYSMRLVYQKVGEDGISAIS